MGRLVKRPLADTSQTSIALIQHEYLTCRGTPTRSAVIVRLLLRDVYASDARFGSQAQSWIRMIACRPTR